MNRKGTMKKRVLSGLLAVSLAATLLTVFVALASPDPTVHVDGLELRMVGEYKTDIYGQYELDNNGQKIPIMENGVQKQSIQALVSISISDTGDNLVTAAELPLHYNDTYLVPSDWETNGEITALPYNVEAAANDPLHRMFFRADEDLYGGKDPFAWDVAQNMTGNQSVIELRQGNVLYVLLSTRSDLTETGYIRKVSWEARDARTGQVTGSYEDRYFYVDGTNKTTLGTLSFRVKDTGLTFEQTAELLQKLAENFNGGTNGQGKDGNSLFWAFVKSASSTAISGDWITLHTLAKKGSGTSSSYNRVPLDNQLKFEIYVEADDVLVKAEPVKDKVTINSYQAYTDGAVSDLALAMQKYAEDVRTTYVSGTKVDTTIYWGDPATTTNAADMPVDGPGMLIQKDGSNDIYRFTWDSTSSTGYKFEKQVVSGSTTTYVTADPVNDFGYDPRGNNQVYKISQYYTYVEAGGIPGSGNQTAVRKVYPIPIEVELKVTPIRVIGATVDKETITYPNHLDDIPGSYAGLNLAEDAKLTLDVDTTLNGVTPTLPVTWTPGTLTALTNGTPGPGNTALAATWPKDSNDITAKTGVGTYTFTTNVTEAQIKLKFPWVTTTTANDYTFTAKRIIVDEDTPSADVPELAALYTMTVEPYEVHAGDTVGLLRVRITKKDSNGDPVAMASGYTFRLFQPDGTEIMVDKSFNTSETVQWFGAQNGTSTRWDGDAGTDAYYEVTELGGTNGYEIIISPGKLMADGAAGNYQSNLEKLRRDVNLGGWFGVQVHEPSKTAQTWTSNVLTDGVWTDRITAYSEPRTNLYIESHKTDPDSVSSTTDPEQAWFDYTKDNVGLMPFYTDSNLPTFVSLPADASVAVRYDTFSGAQPGTLRQFAVNSWAHVSGDRGGSAGNWRTETKDANGSVTAPAEIVTYGADLFARSYDYSNNGRVVNPTTTDSNYGTTYASNTDVTDRQVLIKVQVQGGSKPSPVSNTDLRLTYEQAAGDAIAYTSDGEVERVTFNTKKEGYTYQQVVTLTLTNTGTTEIRDIHINVPNLPSASEPCFTILSAPAVNLPAGASTTFQISYVPNLPKGDYENTVANSNVPVNIIYDGTGSKTFEAVLKVTDSRIHRVNLVVHPGEEENTTRDMGDATLVMGITTGSVQDVYNGAGATNTYEQNNIFWVLTQPADEYELLTLNDNGTSRAQVYYYVDNDHSKAKVYLYEYPTTIPAGGQGGAVATDYQSTDNGPERLFWGVMPDYAVTIHVHYYEPLLSKLRLSDLHAFAWDSESDAMDTSASNTNPYQWKENDQATLKAAGYEKDLLDSQENGYQVILFDPDIDQYTVVLQPESTGKDNVCGLSVTLRQLLTLINGVDDKINQDIKPTVLMTLDDGADTRVGGEPATGDTATTASNPAGSGPTTHYSMIFDAPKAEPGQTTLATKTVTITISFDGANTKANNGEYLTPSETLVEREYKVRFVRALDPTKEEAKHQSLPGNSPYGMIENDKTIVDAGNVEKAKTDFDVENRFRKTEYTPKVVTNNAMTDLRYWTEAWGTGTDYDRDATALFIYLGKDFYDPGVTSIYNNAADLIDGVDVKRTLTAYYEMDTAASSAAARFNNSAVTALSTTAIDLGTVRAVGGAIPGKTTTVAGNTYSGSVAFTASNIRPGIYKLTYTFPDYDDPLDTNGAHTNTKTMSFTRPLIILAPVGDVNADLSVTNSDATAIRGRFSTALPTESSDYPLSSGAAADSLLYTYRILDANNDRNINNVDADLIRRVARLNNPTKLTEFYLPTHYTDPDQP